MSFYLEFIHLSIYPDVVQISANMKVSSPHENIDRTSQVGEYEGKLMLWLMTRLHMCSPVISFKDTYIHKIWIKRHEQALRGLSWLRFPRIYLKKRD